MKHGAVDRGLVAIEVFDEGLDAALVLEDVFLVDFALIDEANADARVQERQFPQSPRQDVVVKFDVREGCLLYTSDAADEVSPV